MTHGFASPKVRELSPTLRTVNLTESGMLPKNIWEKAAEISLNKNKKQRGPFKLQQIAVQAKLRFCGTKGLTFLVSYIISKKNTPNSKGRSGFFGMIPTIYQLSAEKKTLLTSHSTGCLLGGPDFMGLMK